VGWPVVTGQPTTIASDSPPPPPQDSGIGDAAELVLEDRFSMVPEWVLDADIGDCALRLYAVLLRYGNSTGARMPARSTLAARLHKRSTDTVDRALAELVTVGAVQVEHRWAGRQRLTNRYRIRTSGPGSNSPASSASGSDPGGGRTDAATPWSLIEAAVRTRLPAPIRPGVAARMRHNRESPTETPPPLLPHHPLHRRARPPGEVVEDRRPGSGHAVLAVVSPAPIRSDIGNDATRNCSPTAASVAARPGTTTSPRSAPPAETPGNR